MRNLTPYSAKKCCIKLQLTRKEETNASLTLPRGDPTPARSFWRVMWVKQGHDVNTNPILSAIVFKSFGVSTRDKESDLT